MSTPSHPQKIFLFVTVLLYEKQLQGDISQQFVTATFLSNSIIMKKHTKGASLCQSPPEIGSLLSKPTCVYSLYHKHLSASLLLNKPWAITLYSAHSPFFSDIAVQESSGLNAHFRSHPFQTSFPDFTTQKQTVLTSEISYPWSSGQHISQLIMLLLLHVVLFS